MGRVICTNTCTCRMDGVNNNNICKIHVHVLEWMDIAGVGKVLANTYMSAIFGHISLS